MFVTLDEVKRQLNILLSETTEDDYLNYLIEVSEDVVSNYLNYSLSDYTNETLPKAIKHGILMIISDLYANRESISFAQGYKIPGTLDLLLSPLRACNV